MIDANGIITTIAGNGDSNVSGDGGPPTQAGLGGVYGIVFDREGNLYLTSGGNLIRKITFPPKIPPMCRNPAVYDTRTKKVSIKEIDVPVLDSFNGEQTGIGVFAAELTKAPGIDDFQITRLDFSRYIPAHDSSHAYYQYNDGIYANGGKLYLCVSVPQIVVLPPNQVIPAPAILYSIVMRNLAAYPDIFHIESAQLIQ